MSKRPHESRRPYTRRAAGGVAVPGSKHRDFWEPLQARVRELYAAGLTRRETVERLGTEFGYTPHVSAVTKWTRPPKPRPKAKPSPTYTAPRRLSDDERSAWRAFIVDELSRGARLRYGYRAHAADGARVTCPDYAGSAPGWFLDHGAATQDVPDVVADAMLSDGAIRLLGGTTGGGAYARCTEHKRRKAA
jgi:hypothetical protein